ncbi:MAG TPA: pectin acetylesterase-family hydrolase [Kofleriaceae bacterium]|nr:pectin acetylesterase-family hydrolase [Kofleriaceae bacterium]
MRLRLLASLLACSSLLFACGDDDDGDSADDNAPDAAPEADAGVDAAPAGLPGLDDLADGWNELAPGGDTICSRGTDYAYWVRKGSVNKVVIDFIGGGACWDATTCAFADSLFEETVDSVRDQIDSGEAHGFYDDQNEANPFKDWYHVIIPYCTGDVHWGDAVAVYSEGQPDEVTINHKGAVNSRAVLGWVYDNFDTPEQVMVTGCSAGAYGAALWSAYVMQQYPDSQVFQFGDSGAGIITDSFFQDSFPSWNAQAAFPTFIPELDPGQNDILDSHLPDLYAGIANFFPDRWMSQYNTIRDENQYFFYQAMGGGALEEWTQGMLDSVSEIESRAPNFSAFIAPGEQHCILPYDNFYTVESNGVTLIDWLNEMLTTGGVASTKCQDTECDGDTP